MNHPLRQHNPLLPVLSDAAAVELRDLPGSLYQLVEAHYADHIHRHYQTSGILYSPVDADSNDDPF